MHILIMHMLTVPMMLRLLSQVGYASTVVRFIIFNNYPAYMSNSWKEGLSIRETEYKENQGHGGQFLYFTFYKVY